MKIEKDILKTACVVILLVLVYCSLVMWPTQRQNKALADDVQAKRAEFEKMDRPDLEPLRLEIKAIKEELRERSIALPDGELHDQVLAHVSNTLLKQNISIYETSVRNAKHYKRFAVTPIDVRFEGRFLSAFEAISRIENAGPPVRVERLELAGDVDDTSGFVVVNMQLSSFFLTEEGRP